MKAIARITCLVSLTAICVACGGGGSPQPARQTTDSTSPVISLIGDNPQVIAVGDPYIELGATAIDNVDGDLTTSIVIDASPVDDAVPGTYLVTYNVRDAAGNAADTVMRTVIYEDRIPPVITLVGDDPQIIAVGDPYTELGATAMDNVDGDLTDAILIDWSGVDTNMVGDYTVKYDVTDASGNAATAVFRTVTVQSPPAPPPNSAISFGWRHYADTGLQFADFYDQNFTIVARVMLQYPRAYEAPIIVASSHGFEISKQNRYAQLRARFGDRSYTYSSVALPSQAWHHIAIRQLDGMIDLYLDGAQICPDGIDGCSVQAGSAEGLLRIGRKGGIPAARQVESQFFGLVDDVAVFGEALSVSRIQQLVVNPRLAGSEPGLRNGWTFDDLAPDGSSLPPTLDAPVTYYVVTPSGDVAVETHRVTVSQDRDSARDLVSLPPPNNQVPLRLPFLLGEAWIVSQGWQGSGSHHGRAAFAMDFRLAGQPTSATEGKPFYTAAPGTVEQVEDNRTSCSGYPANHIDVRHAADEYGVYLHHVRSSAAVSVGQIVTAGEYLADTGDTGNSGCNNFHLHFALHNFPETEYGYLVTIPGGFEGYEVSTDDGQTWSAVTYGTPEQGSWVRNP